MSIELSEKPKKGKKIIITILFIVAMIISAFGGYYVPKYVFQYLETEDMLKEKQMLDMKLDKFQSQKELFISNIERKYKDVKFLIGQNEIEAALKMIDDFKRFEVIDYKDVAQLYKQLTIEFLVNESIKIPQNDLLGNFEMYNILHELDPDSDEFKYKNIYYRVKLFDLMDLQKTPEYIEQCQIQYIRSKFYDFYDFVSYEAQLKNLSDEDITKTQVIILWFDLNDRITITKLDIGEEVFFGPDSFVISEVAVQHLDIKAAKLFFKSPTGEILKTCK